MGYTEGVRAEVGYRDDPPLKICYAWSYVTMNNPIETNKKKTHLILHKCFSIQPQLLPSSLD